MFSRISKNLKSEEIRIDVMSRFFCTVVVISSVPGRALLQKSNVGRKERNSKSRTPNSVKCGLGARF